MGRFFFYTREKQVKKTDDQGNAIPLKDEKGDVIPNQYETETKKYIDSFNLNKVIRTHVMTENHVVVLLDDGHEESQVIGQKKKNPNKGTTPDNLEEVKQRVWIQSEISVKGDDVQKLYTELANV
jgi:hypothetical protein